jgi:hypothetical protein
MGIFKELGFWWKLKEFNRRDTALPCFCCGDHANTERARVVGILRCDWCMGNCVIGSGEHKACEAEVVA